MDSHHLLFAGLPALPIPGVRVTTIGRLKSIHLGKKLQRQPATRRKKSPNRKKPS
jgi:hypothetical protein